MKKSFDKHSFSLNRTQDKKASSQSAFSSFADFLEDPPIAASLVVFALLALMFSLMQFDAAIR